MSSKSSKYPRTQAKTETYRVQWSKFQTTLCLGRLNSWWKCRRPFPDDGVQQRTVEQIVDAPVPQAVEELAEVSKVFSQDRIQQRIVEETIPAIPLAEKIVELPIIHTKERMQQGVNTHAQHVVNTVEVEKSKIIKQTGQKSNIQEKINPVTKHVEVPLSQFTGKAMDIPVAAQRQISMETVQKSIETPQLQYGDEVVDIPVQLVEQVPHVHVVAKTPEIPQLQITDKVIDVPVVSAMQVPRVCAVKKTAETPQLPLVKKIGVIPETIEIPLGINSESSVGSTQQQHNHHRKQQQQQAGQTEEEKEEGERRKGERGKEEERDAEEQECKQVKKDATGWTVVTRNKRERKMVRYSSRWMEVRQARWKWK